MASEKYSVGVKAFVPSIVKLLENANEIIRQTSKRVLKALAKRLDNPIFQSDLKNELKIQNVRQTTIDYLLCEGNGRFHENEDNSAELAIHSKQGESPILIVMLY